MRKSDIAYVKQPLYNPPPPKELPPLEEMELWQIKDNNLLCAKSHGDPTTCIGCVGMCTVGYRVIELLEKETSDLENNPPAKLTGLRQKLDTMKEYVAAMASSDPIKYILEHTNSKSENSANIKLKRWKQTYGCNMGMIQNHIKQIEETLNVQKEITDKVKANKAPEIKELPVSKMKTSSNVNKALSDKQEELKKFMHELEEQVKSYERAIQRANKQIETYKEQLEALEKVAFMFDKGDKAS